MKTQKFKSSKVKLKKTSQAKRTNQTMLKPKLKLNLLRANLKTWNQSRTKNLLNQTNKYKKKKQKKKRKCKQRSNQKRKKKKSLRKLLRRPKQPQKVTKKTPPKKKRKRKKAKRALRSRFLLCLEIYRSLSSSMCLRYRDPKRAVRLLRRLKIQWRR